jgi:hypothetical protein
VKEAMVEEEREMMMKKEVPFVHTNGRGVEVVCSFPPKLQEVLLFWR